jgi:CheY-like chemotaxis protein
VARLLIVDDDRTLVDLLSQIVTIMGHTPVGAYDGQQALDLVEAQPFDLMLLDLMMPVLDGFETLRRLRSTPKGRDLPVVVVTAMSDPDVDRRVAAAGGNACLRKPVSFEALSAAIEAHLHHG